MRTVLALFTAVATLGACTSTSNPSPVAKAQCPALPGTDELLAMRDKRAFIFGEIHGTAEAPALFADFVCAAAQQGPVLVGLELAEEEQPALDVFLASDGSPQARAALLARPHWQSQDGRASRAKLALVERLHALRAAGLPVGALAFVRRTVRTSIQTPYEQAMARRPLHCLTARSRGASLTTEVMAGPERS